MSRRPLTAVERELLEAVLAHEFPGVAALRAQAASVTASPGCTCGCGTIALHVPDGHPRSTAESPVPVEGTVLDDGGGPAGGLLLLVEDGRLAGLEVYPLDDHPLALPEPSRVRWSRA